MSDDEEKKSIEELCRPLSAKVEPTTRRSWSTIRLGSNSESAHHWQTAGAQQRKTISSKNSIRKRRKKG